MFDSTSEHIAVVASRQCFPANGGAVETVAWLVRWCPDQARAHAVAMHELAAWEYDDNRTDHWSRVLELLPKKLNLRCSVRSSDGSRLR
jgi:hypothetical protein